MQGLETLALRMDAHVANAARVAEHLRAHPLVSWVSYAGFDDSPSSALAHRYLPKGPGAVMAFGVVGGRDGGRDFIEALELCSHLANIGDTRTLVIHPASTTHQQLSDDAMKAAGVPPDLIRISVGIEDVDDILWDIDRALEHAAKQVG
jgi:O-acetylhomoserine (thiol)-lyase